VFEMLTFRLAPGVDGVSDLGARLAAVVTDVEVVRFHGVD